MLETKKPFAAGLALALLAATGCYDFDTEFKDCLDDGQCLPAVCDPLAVDLPDDLFFDANCDEVDGTPGDAIFVDPAGQDSNAGTREAPIKRLSAALKAAVSQGKKSIYLAQGTYDEADLRMEQAVSLYGGYAGMAGNWKRGKDYITRIGGSTPTGFTVSGLMDAGVAIEWVHIGSANSTVPGTPSIGLRVIDSSGVRLRHVEVEAGAGAPGRDGDSPGPNTQVGADGGVGLDGSASTPSGGPRGAGSCGTGSYAGGMGGAGGRFGTAPVAGTAGEPYTTGGGTAATNKLDTACSTTVCVCDGEQGGEGQPGEVGGRGKDGTAGDGTGVLEGSTWVAKSGTDGEAGTVGKGGGGGGGGGFCEAPGSTQSKGGGGGGGGAGGCPGAGAKGGQSGGASIALLLLRAHVEMESCTLKTGGGGKGGAGGTGGAGGPGGQGGAGGKGILVETMSGPDTYRATGGMGGKGGKGGDGGQGGHGGNGAGGPSVGVWCDSPESSSVTPQGMTFGLKDPGAPGAGPGAKGNPGLLTNYHQCSGSP
ncbi:uncharacterized protein DUF1565 [Archangium gephyra]|uniref:PE family protein n=1 Tax=Archangium gephyra TaxID=48 RepID=A0AAC8Q2Y5_9BACT|nr:DUF1565 domain-containing protein [Archangium gephyra]AKJ00063.1 PE family protein [Archangium gephyra]REG33235.1 uncharacterized protein DUF1565 [Archangium gephyra]